MGLIVLQFHTLQLKQRKTLKTYALGFDKNDEDLKRARIYSQYIKSDHKEYYFDPVQEWSSFKNIAKLNEDSTTSSISAC